MTSLGTRSSAPASETITGCRSCGSSSLIPFLDLGRTPLADRLLTAKQLEQPEIFAPLEAAFCPECTLVQITETVRPEILFCEDYPYFSSVSPALMEHFRRSAEDLIQRLELDPESLVVEAASNDGYLLKHFAARGIPVLGIDPADGPAKAAQEAGITTINAFFTTELAKEFQKAGMKADLFLANNVLAHVPDLNGFVEGIRLLLKEDGMAVIEAPYLLDLIANCEFDTIYHQHLCYFSVTALDRLFRRHGLFLNEVARTALHGGSLRLFLGKKEAVGESTRRLLEDEANKGAGEASFYRTFASRVESLRDALMGQLHAFKEEGKRIAAYGAAAKACTLLNFCGIDGRLVDYVADLNTFKQGRFMGGNHLPIEPPGKILQDPPDILLILAWNFAEEIMEQLAEFGSKGRRFLIPIPEVRIV